jgi:hypothetical protein
MIISWPYNIFKVLTVPLEFVVFWSKYLMTFKHSESLFGKFLVNHNSQILEMEFFKVSKSFESDGIAP